MERKTYKNILLILMILFLINVPIPIYADVGSFESYDSGGSSYSSDYSYSTGSSYSGYSSSSYNDEDFGIGELILAIIIIVVFVIGITKSKKHDAFMPRNIIHHTIHKEVSTFMSSKPEEMIEFQIKNHDELFNKEKILAWSKTLFIKLQQAWTKRDWEEIRTFETNELFEQHKAQLQGYIDNNTINVMDRICVNYAQLHDYNQSGDKEFLVIRLNSRMADYIIDARTKEVIKGDPDIELTNTYLLTFERKFGLKSEIAINKVKDTNCPNCGAPTQVTSSGKCDYCGSVITNEEYNWCLSNLERI